MVSHAKRRAVRDSTTFWLSQLQDAHIRVLNAIEELAQLTDRPVPNKDELPTVRWRLSAASLSRRLLWGRIHSLLASRTADQKIDNDLRHLQEVDRNLMHASTNHVGRWNLDAIFDDWTGYCEASKAMRRKMTDAISEEKRLLYPILSEFESEDRAWPSDILQRK